MSTISESAARTDGSAPANRALTIAAGLTEDLGLTLAVVTVSSDNVAGRNLLAEAESFFTPHGIEASTILERGTPSDAILTAVEREGSDLLIMGAYGHSRVRELLLGSTTDAILRRAKVPVLLYR